MKQQFLSKFSAALKDSRLKRGLTEVQAAEYLGISTSLYTRLENALQMPSLNLTFIICDKFRISLDSLTSYRPASGITTQEFLRLCKDLKECGFQSNCTF